MLVSLFPNRLQRFLAQEEHRQTLKDTKITFEQFFGYSLMSIAEKCGNTVPDVIMKLINCEAVEGKSTKADDMSARFASQETGKAKKKADAAGW